MGARRPALFMVLTALVLVLTPRLAVAQTGNISGTVRDTSGGVLAGVTVEVSSPQMIEKVRATVTDENGRYQIVSLPVGSYTVSFKLDKFATVERSNVELTSDFTAPINADMKLGAASEIITVQASTEMVDVQNARQRQVFERQELADLPIPRNTNSLLQLVPGIAIAASNAGRSAPRICSGGQADAGIGVTPPGPTGIATGAVSGCNPLMQTFNAHASINDTESQSQGRLQVDGLNIQGATATGEGRSAYVADISNAQEVAFTLSGSLGESETGGTTINIVPRTGGNRYSGNFFTAYSGSKWYGKNDETRPSALQHRLLYEYDINGSYGGPVLRDRLWFYGTARRQDRENFLFVGYRNLNAGAFGANYQYDPDNRLHQTDLYQNASLRLTVQATQKNKFNIFWDEQYTCENPCNGAGTGVSPEATSSQLTHPLHLAQLSWTNPLSNKILLEGAVSVYGAHRDESRSESESIAYPSNPRIFEFGATTMLGPNATGVQMEHGSINDATINNVDNVQSRLSASYVTGSHNVKLGYQGVYMSRSQRGAFNDLRLRYRYDTPAAPGVCVTAPCLAAANSPTPDPRFIRATNEAGVVGIASGCYFNPEIITTNVPSVPGTGQPAARTWCGSINLPGNPGGLNDPINSRRLPIPTSLIQYIPSELDETVWDTAFYLQDQWTLNRFTFSGAVRYDNAQSKFGKTCVEADLYNPYSAYCLNDPTDPLNGGGTGKGVYFQDITPRWGVAWDVFGNGKTAVKYSQGKYLDGAQVGGIYTAANPAAANRTLNFYQRSWIDANGDRRVDCNLQIPEQAPSSSTGLVADGECGGAGTPSNGSIADSRRFGRSPAELDEENLAIGLGTIYCGQDEPSMNPAVRTYCNSYFEAGGKSLLSGWNRRRYEWQTSIGVQHEVLPRFSAEVTYNRRVIGNQTVSDSVQVGCDFYASTSTPVNPEQCMTDLLNFKSDFYDFYAIQAPEDPRLPGGGGYLISGIATAKQTTGTTPTNVAYIQAPSGVGGGGVTAVTLNQGRRHDVWSGVDTNFVLRAARGLRLSGGTSTGRRSDNQCEILADGNPPTGQIVRVGGYADCQNPRPFQTNIRGTATYTIPWVDVLVSSTFSYRPGVQVTGTYTIPNAEVIWLPGSGTQTQTGQPRVPGAILNSQNSQVSTNVLDNTFYGEGIRLLDFRLAKNIRFAGKRVNIGADVFNLFNSDAALQYCGTIPNPAINPQACGTTANPQYWRQVINITTPRFARFQVQFDF